MGLTLASDTGNFPLEGEITIETPPQQGRFILATSFRCEACGVNHTDFSGLIDSKGRCKSCGQPTSAIPETEEFGIQRIKRSVLLIYAVDAEDQGLEVEKYLKANGVEVINAKRIIHKMQESASMGAVGAMELAFLMRSCAQIVPVISKGLKNAGLIEEGLQVLHERGYEKDMTPIYTDAQSYALDFRGGVNEYVAVPWEPQVAEQVRTGRNAYLTKEKMLSGIQSSIQENT